MDEDAFGILKGLLNDNVPTVQQTAALAIGRMASFSTELSEEVVKCGILTQLNESMESALAAVTARARAILEGTATEPKTHGPPSTSGQLKAGAFVIKAIAQHTPALCECCIESGSADILISCLENLDATVREAAANTLAVMSSHLAVQASAIVSAGAMPLLVTALGEPETSLRRAAASAIYEIAKHGTDLAQEAVQANCLPHLAEMLSHPDVRLVRQVAGTIGQIVKHTPESAMAAVTSGIFPAVMIGIEGSDPIVSRLCAIILREIAKHSEALASIVVEAGGPGTLVQYISSANTSVIPQPIPVDNTSPSNGTVARAKSISRTQTGGLTSKNDTLAASRQRKTTQVATKTTASGIPTGAPAEPEVTVQDILPGIMALGFIAAYSEFLANSVIRAAGIEALKACMLAPGAEDHVRAACVWTLGQIGRHSPDTARAVVVADTLRHIQMFLVDNDSSDDLKDKSSRCLRVIIAQADHVPAFQSLLFAAPAPIAKALVHRLATVLRINTEARKLFVTSGGLKDLQALDPSTYRDLQQFGPVAVRNYVSGQGKTLPGHIFAASLLAQVSAGKGDHEIEELVSDVNSIYPADVVAFCRPDYALRVTMKAEGR